MPDYGETLTEREIEIVQMVATGVTNREIAYRLSISTNTVKVHLRNIFAKLGAESRTEATMIAVREGWVVVEDSTAVAPDESMTTSPQAVPMIAEPPLPLLKRVTLIATLALVVVAVAVTWPHSRPQAGAGQAIPLLPPQQSGAGLAEAGESSWHERAQMPTRRAYLALAAVGERIFAIAGQTIGGATTAVVEIYDPQGDLWTRGSDKPTPATHVAAAVIGTDIYVPGGCDAEGHPTQSVEVYDTQTDSWRAIAPLPQPRCAYALAAWQGQVYLFGGWDGARYTADVYAYDPQTDSWRAKPPMPVVRGFAAAAMLQDRLYVVGGYDGERELATCAAYDPATNTWADCAPLIVGRGGLGLVAAGGQLYAIGGGGWTSTSYLGFNERYSPASDTWTSVETPRVGEWNSPGVVAFENVIYAIGGWSSDYLSVTLVYEPLPFRIFIPLSNQP
jgi:DNA-binding CsgD family transcriptional regulator/N-acetylneuraminic acid mutarotase